MLDMSTIGQIFLNILSNIPWWIYPLIILFAYLMAKIKDAELEHKIRKTQKIYDKIDNEKESNIDKKEKGDKYEAFICENYKKIGYTIAPHGKDNGVRDQGIDIIAKKNKEILFIQCKNWNAKSGYKINHKDIQYIRMNVRDYLEKNPLFKNYDWRILYITSENILDKSAQYKIRENLHEIEHKVIPI